MQQIFIGHDLYTGMGLEIGMWMESLFFMNNVNVPNFHNTL